MEKWNIMGVRGEERKGMMRKRENERERRGEKQRE